MPSTMVGAAVAAIGALVVVDVVESHRDAVQQP
jgi:hypothetical protein